MTLANLLKLAHEELADDKAHRTARGTAWHDDARAQRLMKRCPQLARAILSLLTAETCGWERPVSGVRDGEPFVEVPASWATRVSPADARVMAVMLLRSADESEKTNG